MLKAYHETYADLYLDKTRANNNNCGRQLVKKQFSEFQ